MKAKRYLGLVLALLLFVVPSAFATSITIADLTMADLLVPGATIRVGDKIFGNFTDYVSGGSASGVPSKEVFIAPLISVSPLDGETEFGLRFYSVFWGAGAGLSQDTSWDYAVWTADGSDRITDNVLAVGGYSAGDPLAFARITESAADENFIGVATKLVGQIPNSTQEVFFVQKYFPAQNYLNLTKDIALNGGASWIAISDVTQQFSQTGGKVPEPISLILLGSGLAGAGLYRRLRKPKG
jgi:hypothetical protein